MKFIDSWCCTEEDVRKVWDEAFRAHEPILFYGRRGEWPRVPGGSFWCPKPVDVSMSRLRRIIGDREVPVVTQRGSQVIWDPRTGLGNQMMSFEDFELALQLGEKVYLQGRLRQLMGDVWDADFVQDMRLPKPWRDVEVAREKFWVSGNGLVTPLHYDAAETMHWVLKGSKTFRLFRPGIERYAPYPANSTAPFISKLQPTLLLPEDGDVVFEMHEGDILYLPSYWWHWVRSEDDINVSMNYVWKVGALRQLANFRQMWRCRAHVKKQLG
jgi:hypothetical protein